LQKEYEEKLKKMRSEEGAAVKELGGQGREAGSDGRHTAHPIYSQDRGESYPLVYFWM